MKNKLHFEITINAPAGKVWDVMLGEDTYKEWTTAFDPTSSFEGSWEKGENIKFISSKSGDGMFSEIAENIPHKYISIKHLGVIKNGIIDRTSDEAKKWTSAYENYTFMNEEGKTNLKIDIEMDFDTGAEEMIEMFKEMWPNALSKLKEICEKQD
jgi:uncharacterized protein YndB with AHSA1/START domain